MTETVDPLITTKNLTRYFLMNDSLLTRFLPHRKVQQVHAVDGVDLTVRAGETISLVGESGCGKSTLARTLLRLIEPTEGSVFFKDNDITKYDSDQLRDFRSEAQMVFQDPFASLNPRYSIQRTLTEPMEIHGIGDSEADRYERAVDLVERVGLTEEHLKRYPHEFSGGQRQRVGIARALSVEPELIIADEPISALDVSVQAQIVELLDEIQEEMGLSLLFIQHDLATARQISDRIAVMYLGSLVEVADTTEIFENPKHPYTQSLLSSIPVPDPSFEYEQIPLEGDVPTPIDPPRGCRFHPRCPKVIPPDDWAGSQQQWRRVLRLKAHLKDGTIKSEEYRRKLSTSTDRVDDKDLVDALYDEYIGEQLSNPLPESVERKVRHALEMFISDNGDGSPVAFSTPCERKVPRKLEEGDHMTACHLHDSEMPGEDDQRFELRAGQRNEELR